MFKTVKGTSYSCGKTLGRWGGQVLRKRIAKTKKIQRAQEIPDTLIDARIRDFARNLRKVVPHWLDEAKGMADGAGVAVDDILMLNCLPPGFYPPTGSNCTSFVSVGKQENRLFKIRDERNHVQSFHVHGAQRRKAFQAGRDIGNLGTAHFFNQSCVAGANNTGSCTTLVSGEPKLNDCHMHRYFAERASCVEDIPGLFERLIDRKVAGGAGKGRGAIFLFADANRGLLLECVENDYAATFIDKGTLAVSNHFLTRKAKAWESEPPNKNTCLRKQRMDCLLARHGNAPSLTDVFAISRDRKSVPHSLCNDDGKHFWMTISAQLQVINRQRPGNSVNYVCCGNTRHSVYIPVPIAATESFVPLVNGEFYKLADALYRKHHCSAHFRKSQKAIEKRTVACDDSQTLCREAYGLLKDTRDKS